MALLLFERHRTIKFLNCLIRYIIIDWEVFLGQTCCEHPLDIVSSRGSPNFGEHRTAVLLQYWVHTIPGILHNRFPVHAVLVLLEI